MLNNFELLSILVDLHLDFRLKQRKLVEGFGMTNAFVKECNLIYESVNETLGTPDSFPDYYYYCLGNVEDDYVDKNGYPRNEESKTMVYNIVFKAVSEFKEGEVERVYNWFIDTHGIENLINLDIKEIGIRLAAIYSNMEGSSLNSFEIPGFKKDCIERVEWFFKLLFLNECTLPKDENGFTADQFYIRDKFKNEKYMSLIKEMEPKQFVEKVINDFELDEDALKKDHEIAIFNQNLEASV